MLNLIKKTYWIRGAISFTKDSPDEIEKATIKFIKHFMAMNKIKEKDILILMIIAPGNLHSSYPCTFIRKNGYKFPCITLSDIEVKNTPDNILRFVIQIKSFNKVKDLYMEEATLLKEKIDNIFK